jgi:hypothetical protein
MMDTQQRINLGQAKNQATEMLKLYVTKNPLEGKEKYKDFYLRWVNNFIEWNTETDLKTEGKVKDNSNMDTPKTTDSKPSSPTSNLPTQLSEKQKRCLRCRLPIPKSFTFHNECGWSE